MQWTQGGLSNLVVGRAQTSQRPKLAGLAVAMVYLVSYREGLRLENAPKTQSWPWFAPDEHPPTIWVGNLVSGYFHPISIGLFGRGVTLSMFLVGT